MRSIKTFSICCLVVFFATNLYAQRIEHNNSKRSSREVKVCPDTIMGITEYQKLQQEIVTLQEQVAQLEKPDIDKFLNIRDTTIFGSKFQKFELRSIPARNYDFYLLIENIHDLNELLNSKSEGNDYEYLKKAKENLEKARNKIVTIIPFATDEKRRVFEFLSPEQNQYWQQLKARYNELNEMFNFNSNE